MLVADLLALNVFGEGVGDALDRARGSAWSAERLGRCIVPETRRDVLVLFRHSVITFLIFERDPQRDPAAQRPGQTSRRPSSSRFRHQWGSTGDPRAVREERWRTSSNGTSISYSTTST